MFVAISLDKDAREVKRLLFWCDNLGLGHLLLILCLYTLLTSQLTNPLLAQSDQHSITSTQSSAYQGKARSSTQESKPAQQKIQTFNSEAKTDVKEEEAEKERVGKKAVSSLILTIKLALLEDPRLFAYEIEVEIGADEITLAGKVSTETENVAAAQLASMVPTVKSVSNKLEVVKDLPDIITQKQDDIITRYVKARFAQSATVSAANFDVKTEQGIVSLSGTVRFQVMILEAAEAARQVPGVKAVKTDKVRIEREG